MALCRRQARLATVAVRSTRWAEAADLASTTGRTADGRTKREIIRCLKRFLAREIYQRVVTDFRARQEIIQAA